MFDGETVCQRINEIVKQRGITKTKFYEECGISSAAYSLWNKRQTIPSIQNLERIAEYLGTSFEFIITGQTGERDQLSYTERSLISCWERASEDDRKVICAVFDKYGFTYTAQKKEQAVS